MDRPNTFGKQQSARRAATLLLVIGSAGKYPVFTAPDKPKSKLGDKSYPAAWRRPLKGGGNKRWSR